MTGTYDLIVIGTGSAGGTAAKAAIKKGWKVAIIDERPYGGTCPQRGCDPKKVLVGISEIYDDAKRTQGIGMQGEVNLSWSDLKAFKETFTDPVSEQVEDSFKKSGIITYHGIATFIDANQVQVGDEVLRGNKIVIATGAKPSKLPIEGAEHLVTSDGFFELEDLPDRILFVGGGYITFEFAHLCARLGKDVIILHRGRHVLESFDHEMTNKLIEITKDLGIDVHVGTEVLSIQERNDGGYKLNVKKFEHEHEFNADLVIHGAGRTPNVEQLNLEKAGIITSRQGIKINENFQSVSHSHIYAAGDVADSGLPPLTPVAGKEAARLAQHLLEGSQTNQNRPLVPSVVFTYPKLAKIGITQQEASERKIPYEVQSQDISSFFTYRRTQDKEAYVKILTNPETDEIIGAHFLTRSADHLVNLFLVAMTQRMTKHQLSSLLWAYPSEESDIPSFF